MLINHNILHKIIDKTTRNIWKYKFANINNEYNSIYEYNLKNSYLFPYDVLYKKFVCSNCESKEVLFFYNYRECRNIYNIYINHHNICGLCRLNSIYSSIIPLPKNYMYTGITKIGFYKYLRPLLCHYYAIIMH